MTDTKSTGTAAAKPKTAAAEPAVLTGALPEGFAPPVPTRGGGSPSKYPFDGLEVGQAFGVGNKTKRQIASAVNNANKRYRSVVKDAAGNEISKTQDREFYAVDVDAATAKTLKGGAFADAKVLVIRSK